MVKVYDVEENPSGVGGSGGSRTLVVSSGDSGINSMSSGQVPSQLEGVQVLGETNVQILQTNLMTRLKEMESNFEIIKKETINLESQLLNERQQRQEMERKAKAREKAKDDKIAELKKKLSERRVKSITSYKTTTGTTGEIPVINLCDSEEDEAVEKGLTNDELCGTSTPTIPTDRLIGNSIYAVEPQPNKRARFGDAGSTSGSLLRRDALHQVRPIPIPGFSKRPPQMSSTSNNSHQRVGSLSSQAAQHWPPSRVQSKRHMINNSTLKPHHLPTIAFTAEEPYPLKPVRRFLNLTPIKKSTVIPRRPLPFNAGHMSVGAAPSNSLTSLAAERKVVGPLRSFKSKTSPRLPQPSTSRTVAKGVVPEKPRSAPPHPQKVSRSGRHIKANRRKFDDTEYYGSLSIRRLRRGHNDINPLAPQKFSRSGRLIKPNRLKFSPKRHSTPIHTLTRSSFRKSYLCGDAKYCEELTSPSTLRRGDNVFNGERDFANDNTDTDSQDDDLDDSAEADLDDSDDDNVPDSASKAFVEVPKIPKWRIVEIDDLSESDDDAPKDDMSEAAYIKRHKKPEAREKQVGRWEAQRMREEAYRENMRRKEEERERLRELRMQQRKDGKRGRH